MADEPEVQKCKPQGHSTGTYIRNTNCWAADIDLTMCSPWNNDMGKLGAGTLVSPRHALFVNHLFTGGSFIVDAGSQLRFVDAANGVYTAAIESVHHIDSLDFTVDLTVAVLEEDVPTNRFSFAKILPSNFTNYFGYSNVHVPGLGLDQEEKALVRNFSGVGNAGTSVPVWCSFSAGVYGDRADYYEGVVGGDSGNPAFIILNNEPVLGTLWVSPAGVGSFPAFFKNEINVIMSTNGYSLTEIDLSGYDEIPETLR